MTTLSQCFSLRIAKQHFDVPIRQVNGVRIAYLDFLCDRRLIQCCADLLSDALRPSAGAIVVPESGAIPLGFLVAQQLDRPCVVLRKRVRGYMGERLSVPVESVASVGGEQLILECDYIPLLRHWSAVLLDTVTSSGSTLRAMRDLVELARIAVDRTAVAFIEGEAVNANSITHIGRLPIFS